jgi:WXG100 family type VII secretion target
MKLKVSPGELSETAKVFKEASQSVNGTIRNLDDRMKHLQTSWQDIGSENFFRTYQEWQQYSQGFVGMLEMISKEMDAMARRYDEAGR